MEQVDVIKIKKLIKDSGFSQYDLADRLGIGQSTVSKRLENGDFRVEELLKLSNILGVSIKDFFKVADRFKLSIDIDDVMFDDADAATVASHNTISVLENLGYNVHANIKKVGANEQERLF